MRHANVMTLAIAMAAGCATSGGNRSGSVSDVDFAKVPTSQMGPVDQARQSVSRAGDEQARAELRLREAGREDQLATADVNAAQALADQARTMSQVATENRDAKKLEQSRALMEQAGAQRRAADARSDYATKLIAARQASKVAADKQRALADAKLDLAKLQALRKADTQAANKYDIGAHEQRVQQAQAGLDSAQQQARDQQWWAQQAQRVYADAQRELRAQTSATGSSQTGTGSR